MNRTKNSVLNKLLKALARFLVDFEAFEIALCITKPESYRSLCYATNKIMLHNAAVQPLAFYGNSGLRAADISWDFQTRSIVFSADQMNSVMWSQFECRRDQSISIRTGIVSSCALHGDDNSDLGLGIVGSCDVLIGSFGLLRHVMNSWNMDSFLLEAQDGTTFFPAYMGVQ